MKVMTPWIYLGMRQMLDRKTSFGSASVLGCTQKEELSQQPLPPGRGRQKEEETDKAVP